MKIKKHKMLHKKLYIVIVKCWKKRRFTPDLAINNIKTI